MVRAPLSLLLTALGIVALTTPASPASVSRTYSYFSIGGATLQDLQQQLSLRGPEVQSSGQRHAGATQMEFRDRVRFKESGGRCRIASATVAVKAKIILPRWTKRSSGSPDTRLIWDALAADIKRHEESHVSIARNHARDMEKALLALPPQKSCDALAAKGRETLQRVMSRHDAEQARFDVIEGRNFNSRLERLVRYRSGGSSRATSD